MKSMCVTLLLLVCTASDVLAHSDGREGFQELLNGKDLSGWDGDPRLWTARDGVIRGETTEAKPADGNTFLIWEGGALKDFELRLSYRCNATNNSGIQYRSVHFTGDRARNKWVVRGYQHELRNENKVPNVPGFIYDEGGARRRICLAGEQASWDAEGKHLQCRLMDDAAIEKLVRVDDWNDVVIVAKGDHIQHYLNGELIVDFTDNHPKLAKSEGVLALQLHAGAPMWVEFKDLQLKQMD